MKRLLLSILGILLLHGLQAQQKFSLSGNVKDASNGEDLIGVTVYVKEAQTGSTTNAYGFYSLTLPAGTYQVSYSYIGFETKVVQVNLSKDTKMNIELQTTDVQLQEVVIAGKGEKAHVEELQMSTERLDVQAIKKLPAFLGEVDVMKSIQLLPGVISGGEGSAGFFVRGGSVDQNLILLDEAPVYNASHLLGFFSVFNSDAIKDVQIYKGGIPAQYGGRLSSLVDIRMKDGNAKKLSATGGIGLLASRLTVEAPIIKDRSSFIVSGRRTYLDLFLKASSDDRYNNTILYFYDLNTKLNYKLNDRNRLFVSGYFGRDVFRFGKEFGMNWGNGTGTVRWNHLFSNRLFANFTAIYSNFNYEIGTPEGSTSFKWTSNIEDLSLKGDFNYYLNSANNIGFGLHTIHHTFKPGLVRTGENSAINEIRMDNRYALEHAVYISNEQSLSPRLSVQYGLRYSLFQNIGDIVYEYETDGRTVKNRRDYDRWDINKAQGGLEPRLSARFTLDENSSLKASYNRTLQYLHLASNTTSASPLDIYIPSGVHIKPQLADQVAFGYFRNLRDNTIQASAEVYYKDMRNQIDFRDNADLFLNNHIETEILAGKGRAYGLEVSLKKEQGDFTGWLSYTLSRTERQIEGINNGDWYKARQDRPHNVNLVMAYQLTPRMSIGGNWVYSSGNAATVPVAGYSYNGIYIPVYGVRNSYRMPAYHRLDLSLTVDNKKRPGRRYESSWNFSIYNVYARRNAYAINFRPNEDNPAVSEAVRLSIIGSMVPSVTYNFKF